MNSGSGFRELSQNRQDNSEQFDSFWNIPLNYRTLCSIMRWGDLMQKKLLFLTNQYFYQPTVSALSRMQLDCETKVVVYHTFDQIPQVYQQYADDFDAVLITGTSAKHVLDLKFPDEKKLITAFQVDSDALHRDILRFAIETQNLDFSRIAVDFLVPLNCGFSVVDFLKLDSLDDVFSQNDSLTEMGSIPDSRSVETVILEQILTLWEQKAIDMVLCLYASNVPALQERGIPFRCPYISDADLYRVIQEVLIKTELNCLHDNHPSIIQVFPRYSADTTPRQMQRIYDLLQQYIHNHLIDGVLQQSGQCCTIISSMGILRFLTNEFQVCRIAAWLEDHLDFPVAVAYGIGTTISHAMNNVQIASKEAKILGHSFVVDTNGNLIGPLNSDNRMVISPNSLPDVSALAKRCSLSAMTIQKLQNIVNSNGSDKITIPEMAQKMNTTIRNANRIMLNLCRGNVAKPVYTQMTHARGRPIQVYALDFGTASR